MLRTRAIEDVVLEIPKGSAGRGHGRWQAPHGNPPPPPPVVPVEDAPTLRFPRHSVIFLLDP
jgi:hypothetical protein